jgi:hypothetical protein
VTCATPLDAALLADYWLALLPDTEEQEVDEHLLACDACGARLREVIALAEGVKHLASEGALRMVVSDTFLRRAAEGGARIREYALPAGGSVQCTVSADDDLLVARLAGDLSSGGRIDLSLCDVHGVERMRLADIPVHAGSGEVLYQESMAFAKASATQTLIARLVRVDETDHDQVLAEYVFNHTRTLPGSGVSL